MMIAIKKTLVTFGTVALAQLHGSLPQVGDKLAKASESYCVIPQHMLRQCHHMMQQCVTVAK
jgi:hypothetical protein